MELWVFTMQVFIISPSPSSCPRTLDMNGGSPELYGMPPNPAMLRGYESLSASFPFRLLGKGRAGSAKWTWPSPSRQFRQLSRQWCMVLPALIVFTMGSSSLAETWKVACSKQFPLTRENTACQNVQLKYITTLHLFFPKDPGLHPPSIFPPRKSHGRIFLIIWEQTHQSICQRLWPTRQNGKNSMKWKQHSHNKC